jgi:hypothetical protein
MIRIRFEPNTGRVAISVTCKITEDSEREFNLSRSRDEPISATFQKLYANFTKQLTAKQNKANKKNKKQPDDSKSTQEASMSVSSSDTIETNLPLSLYDLENNLVSLETKNSDAWKEGFVFKLNDQVFKVEFFYY